MNLLKSLFNCQFLLGKNQDAYSFGLATLPFPSVCFHGSSYATVILSLVCVSIPQYTHAASSCFLNEIVFFFLSAKCFFPLFFQIKFKRFCLLHSGSCLPASMLLFSFMQFQSNALFQKPMALELCWCHLCESMFSQLASMKTQQFCKKDCHGLNVKLSAPACGILV